MSTPVRPWQQAPIAWVLRAVFTDPWARIDARERTERCGHVSARTATLITGITMALMMVLLRFGVMDHEFQRDFARGVAFVGGKIDPSWGAFGHKYYRLLSNVGWVVGCFGCYVAIPTLVARFGMGLSPLDCYISPRGYAKQLPKYAALFLPVAVAVGLAVRDPEFLYQYPFYQDALGPLDQISWELAYAFQFFCLEFFFRGFALRGLSPELGAMAAVVSMLPYCMIHFGKPLPECLGSIVAGLVLGTLALDTRSIWGGVTIHVAVAWSMDLAALAHKHQLLNFQ